MKLKWIFNPVYIVYVTFVCCIEGTPDNLKLVLVQMIYRHGDRSPIVFYGNDPNPVSAWPDRLGELTQLGRQQHHSLGKFFRSRYQDFMKSDPSEITVFSTERSRCIQSAISNLATFYPFNEAVEFQQQTSDAQIPIFFMPSAYDEYLGTNVDCPRYRVERKRYMVDKLDQLSKRFKGMFEYYSLHTGDEINSWKKAIALHDTLLIEKKRNYIIPEWADTYWSQLEEIVEVTHTWPTTVALRLRAGPLLKHMIENMQDKIDGKSHLKFHVFSAHSLNIFRIALALKLKITTKVPYCATLIFELYSGQMNSNFVRILYQNSSEPEKEIENPHIIMFDDCEEFCPLEYFIKHTRHLIPVNFQEECNALPDQKQTFLSGVSMAIFGIGIIVLAIITTVFFPKLKLIYHRFNLFKHDLLHQKV